MKKEIRFDTDKNGKRVAYRYSRQQMRWFKMKLAEAENLVATGNVSSVTNRPNPWAADVKLMESWDDANGIHHMTYSYVVSFPTFATK